MIRSIPTTIRIAATTRRRTRTFNNHWNNFKLRSFQEGVLLFLQDHHSNYFSTGGTRRSNIPSPSSSSSSPVNDDTNTIWRNWFQSHEYQSIYNPSPFQDTKNQIQPLQNHPSLDKQTRNMIQILRNMSLPSSQIHQVLPSTSTLDILTTQQCNYMIAYTLSDPNIRKHVKGLSHRAYMIWKTMEYCHAVRTDLHNNNNNNHSGGTTTTHPYSTPKPNRETYLSVLKLHSLEKDDPKAPERAYEIIQFMKQKHEQEPSWDTQPSSMIWNQCISSWANVNVNMNTISTNTTIKEDKAYQVANLIFNIIDKEYLDISSYGHAFKACATCQTSHGKELARNVLLRLWKHFKENEFVLSTSTTSTTNNTSSKHDLRHHHHHHRGSLTFVHMFHALQHLTKTSVKEEMIQDVLYTCQTHGWMNAHVIKAYGSIVSKDTMEETFGMYAKGSEGITTDNKYGHIYQNIPKRWKRNCKANKFGW